MQNLARSLPCLPALFSIRSHLLLHTAAAAAATSCSLSPLIGSAAILSKRELAELRSLLPALCDAGHHLEAVRLLDTALLASPPLSSLPLPDLTDRLCSLPDMTASMALLTAIRLHPRSPSPRPFGSMILSSYFRLRRLREAAKVFSWLCGSDSPCRPDMKIYRITIRGFCEGGSSFEAVRVAREMIRDDLIPNVEQRILLCQVLLREARVQQALDLDSEISKVREEDGCPGNGIKGIAELLDRMINDWEE